MRARERLGLAALLVVAVALAAGCGGARKSARRYPRPLLLEARPIGRGAAFHPPSAGPAVGACTRHLGARYPAAHVEVFAADRVVIVAAGIGARGPLTFSEGRVTRPAVTALS